MEGYFKSRFIAKWINYKTGCYCDEYLIPKFKLIEYYEILMTFSNNNPEEPFWDAICENYKNRIKYEYMRSNIKIILLAQILKQTILKNNQTKQVFL